MSDPDLLLQDYLDKWKLSHPALIAKTPTSSVYKVQRGGPLILKIFTETGAKDEAGSIAALKAWKRFVSLRRS